MVAFRNVVAGSPLTNFRSYGDQQISFSRGGKGFVTLVGDGSTLNQTINTGLPVGDYCDVISGNYVNGTCSGKVIRVEENGEAHISIKGDADDPVIAIHIGEIYKAVDIYSFLSSRVTIYLRNNIFQTVILSHNNITVWSSDARNYITRA
jgi:hypothetical protein